MNQIFASVFVSMLFQLYRQLNKTADSIYSTQIKAHLKQRQTTMTRLALKTSNKRTARKQLTAKAKDGECVRCQVMKF